MHNFTYDAFKAFFQKLVDEGSTTSNPNDEFLIKYTKLNWSRFKRVDKKFEWKVPKDRFEAFENYKLLVITEPWCGDAAQIVPVVGQIAERLPKVDIEIVLRDEQDALMNRYLTNGGKAIPIIVFVKEGVEKGYWGPRPVEAQKLVEAYKALPEEERPSFGEFAEELQKWYNNDATVQIQTEFYEAWKRADIG